MRIIDADTVRAVLPMADAIDAVRWAYVAVSSGRAVMPARIHLSAPRSSAITLVMPCYVEESNDGICAASLAVKTVSVFPGNMALGIPSVLGGVLVLDPRTGACVGLVDGASLTALRTGAGSAVATEALARPDAESVAVFGAGVQAATQLEGVCAVRNIKRGWVFDRNRDLAEEFCARLAGRLGITEYLHVADSPSMAVRDADIICTATGSPSSLFEDADIPNGVHINAIGSYRPDTNEIPAETVARARVFVDHLESALHEAGDLVKPLNLGMISEAHIVGEIGSLVSGGLAGRTSRDEITLFKSVGLAAQDSVCATLALVHANRAGAGIEVNWG